MVATSIPVSIAATFATMYAADLTLNIFTISALALAIGLLVDNAIVVAESIARKMEDGMRRFEAALTGTNEVVGPLLGSTLTTLGVFIPITLISGVQGVFFKEFAITISFAIAISFLSSIILVPVLSILLLDRDQFNKSNFMFKAIHKLENGYGIILKWLLRHKWIPALALLGIIYGTVALYQGINKEGFPETDSGEIDVNVTLTQGTKLVKTMQVLDEFEQILLDKPEIETVVSSIGRSRFSEQTNRGSFTLKLVPLEERSVTSSEVAAALRQELVSPGATVRASVEGGGIRIGGRSFRSGGGSIRLSLIGPEMSELLTISKQIEDKLLEDPNIISVDNGRTDPTPEMQFIIDRNRVAQLGSGIREVANNLRTQTLGNQAGYFRADGIEIPIEVRTAKTSLKSREDLFDLEVLQYEDQRIPVVAVGEFIETKGVDSYNKRNREILLDVSIQFNGDANEYKALISEFINDEVVMPEGYRYEFTGATRETEEGSRQFLIAGFAALVLMFMIMASLFENFRDPFVIWLCIPMAIFGALLSLIILGSPLSTTGNIGLFMLVGIIVNNGIVLVDYMHLRTKGMSYDLSRGSEFLEGIMIACKRRMRPILLTAITTICSMIPLSLELGAGAEIWSPLAKTVIGGLAFGVLFTLFITPAISVGFKQIINWIVSLFGKRTSTQVMEVEVKD